MELIKTFGEHSQPWEKSYPPNLSWDVEIPETDLVTQFDESVKKFAGRPCLSFEGKKLTYRQVGRMVDRFAANLREQGIGKGSKVGLALPNTPFYVIAYYGALKAGATVVNFNPVAAKEVMKHQIEDSKCDMIVTLNAKQIFPNVETMLAETASLKKIIVCDIADALPLIKGYLFRLKETFNRYRGKETSAIKVRNDAAHVSYSRMLKRSSALNPAGIGSQDIAVLQYTGGTTGSPKGVMLTHGNLSANNRQTAMWFSGGKDTESGSQQKMLAVLPFFHVFAMTVLMNQAFELGAELIMHAKFDQKEVLKTIHEQRVTIFAGVPELYKRFMQDKTLDQYDLSSVNLWLAGGAPMPDQTAKAWEELTGKRIIIGYGLSESSPLLTALPLDGEIKSGSIGIPVPGTEMVIKNIDTGEICGTGETGEICARGPQVMAGYLNNPEETDKVIDSDGFLHTGDVGHMDEDGWFFITDRTKDMIIVSGMKVFSVKVEAAIREHEAVSAVCVIGVPDEGTGEKVKAFIVYKPGKAPAPDAELRAFLEDKLTRYAIPRVFAARESLPMTDLGGGMSKPNKKALREEERLKREQGTPALAASAPSLNA